MSKSRSNGARRATGSMPNDTKTSASHSIGMTHSVLTYSTNRDFKESGACDFSMNIIPIMHFPPRNIMNEKEELIGSWTFTIKRTRPYIRLCKSTSQKKPLTPLQLLAAKNALQTVLHQMWSLYK